MHALRFARALVGVLETMSLLDRQDASIYRYPSSHADALPYLFVDATLGQPHATGTGRYQVLAKVEIHSKHDPNNPNTAAMHEFRTNNVLAKLNRSEVLAELWMAANVLGAPITVLEMATELLRPRYPENRVISTIEIAALVS